MEFSSKKHKVKPYIKSSLNPADHSLSPFHDTILALGTWLLALSWRISQTNTQRNSKVGAYEHSKIKYPNRYRIMLTPENFAGYAHALKLSSRYDNVVRNASSLHSTHQ